MSKSCGCFMKAGDLVRWKATGKLTIYLGTKEDLHQFYSAEYGLIERWVKASNVFGLCEVINESR